MKRQRLFLGPLAGGIVCALLLAAGMRMSGGTVGPSFPAMLLAAFGSAITVGDLVMGEPRLPALAGLAAALAGLAAVAAFGPREFPASALALTAATAGGIVLVRRLVHRLLHARTTAKK